MERGNIVAETLSFDPADLDRLHDGKTGELVFTDDWLFEQSIRDSAEGGEN